VRSGRTLEQNLDEAIVAVTEFVNGLQIYAQRA